MILLGKITKNIHNLKGPLHADCGERKRCNLSPWMWHPVPDGLNAMQCNSFVLLVLLFVSLSFWWWMKAVQQRGFGFQEADREQPGGFWGGGAEIGVVGCGRENGRMWRGLVWYFGEGFVEGRDPWKQSGSRRTRRRRRRTRSSRSFDQTRVCVASRPPSLALG